MPQTLTNVSARKILRAKCRTPTNNRRKKEYTVTERGEVPLPTCILGVGFFEENQKGFYPKGVEFEK